MEDKIERRLSEINDIKEQAAYILENADKFDALAIVYQIEGEVIGYHSWGSLSLLFGLLHFGVSKIKSAWADMQKVDDDLEDDCSIK